MPSSAGDIQTVANCARTETDSVLQWSQDAIELFKGLCEDGILLVAHIVPWDPQLHDRLFDPWTDGMQTDICYQKPELCLYLYDTTGYEDIFINQVLSETGLAVFVEKEGSGQKAPVEGTWSKQKAHV